MTKKHNGYDLVQNLQNEEYRKMIEKPENGHNQITRKFRHKDGFIGKIDYVECCDNALFCNEINYAGESRLNEHITLYDCLVHVKLDEWVEILD